MHAEASSNPGGSETCRTLTRHIPLLWFTHSSTPPSLNREPKCEAWSLHVEPPCRNQCGTAPPPLNARLQSHLQSNISVRHLGIFTLATFTTTIILPQHAGQGDMSSAVVTAPSPLQGPPRLPWLFITSTPRPPPHHAVRTFCACVCAEGGIRPCRTPCFMEAGFLQRP